MSTESSIKCPNCAELIDVNEILYHQLENEFKQKNLNEKKKFEEWSERATADMLDIQAGLDKLSTKILGSHTNSLLNDLMEDNADALQQVLKSDVNMSAVDRHILHSKQFLRQNGVTI